MEHVDGEVIRDSSAAPRPTSRRDPAAATEDLVDVLARLHAVDPDDVGLGDLGRKEDYIARQLRRWHGQLAKSRTRDLPLLDEVHERLAADIPEQGPAAIVHGDYRLDNLILDPADGRVRAVLDWELTTLGDPLADVGLLLVYWSEPDDQTIPLLDSPTTVEGFPGREEVARLYAERPGGTCRRSTTTWRSASGSSPASSRACTAATPRAPTARATTASEAFGEVVVALGERRRAGGREGGPMSGTARACCWTTAAC
jgi:aminoglycoside phosphotransferase (APT) family kinase protein